MPDQLKIAIQRQIVSPESEFIEGVLKDADVHDPWRPHTETYDVSVCIGPVTSCPPAKKRVLFVLGQTVNHPDLDWDTVIVTSERARNLCLRKFGHGVRVIKLIPPVLQLNAAKRRLVDTKRGFVHASDMASDAYGMHGIKMLTLWGNHPAPEHHEGGSAWIHGQCDYWFNWVCAKQENMKAKAVSLFTTLEFNSLVRGEAIGFYPRCMEDGYDVQVRRHLALGGRVVCPQDKEVLGDYADLVDNNITRPSVSDMNPVEPVIWEGTEEEYANGIKDIIGRV